MYRKSRLAAKTVSVDYQEILRMNEGFRVIGSSIDMAIEVFKYLRIRQSKHINYSFSIGSIKTHLGTIAAALKGEAGYEYASQREVAEALIQMGYRIEVKDRKIYSNIAGLNYTKLRLTSEAMEREVLSKL